MPHRLSLTISDTDINYGDVIKRVRMMLGLSDTASAASTLTTLMDAFVDGRLVAAGAEADEITDARRQTALSVAQELQWVLERAGLAVEKEVVEAFVLAAGRVEDDSRALSVFLLALLQQKTAPAKPPKGSGSPGSGTTPRRTTK